MHQGNSVCDRNGNKIGTIKKVQQLARAAGAPPTTAQEYAQVETKIQGLPKELYIPSNAFGNCTGDSCFLKQTQQEISRQGWDQKPANL